MATHKLTVAKVEDSELDAVREYLQDLKEVIEDNERFDNDDSEANQKIADVARKYPNRAFLIPMNLGILLDNYQDKGSDILEHPKWIKDMISLFNEMDEFLSADPKNQICNGSDLHKKIQFILGE